MNKEKPTLITIIVALVIVLPFFVIGTYSKLKNISFHKGDKSTLYKDGYLHFYDDDLYIGKYQCKTDPCQYASSVLTDEDINPYKGELEFINVFNGKYVFITDSNTTFLYDVVNGIELIKLEGIKFYNSNIDNDYVFLKNNGKWGLFSLKTTSLLINYTYDHLGLINKVEDSILKSDVFVAKTGVNNYLINKDEEILTEMFEDTIFDYTDDFIVTKGNYFNIYTYEKRQFVSDLQIENYYFLNNLTILRTNNYLLIYEDLSDNYIDMIQIKSSDDLKIEEDEKINIYINDEIAKTIEPSIET